MIRTAGILFGYLVAFPFVLTVGLLAGAHVAKFDVDWMLFLAIVYSVCGLCGLIHTIIAWIAHARRVERFRPAPRPENLSTAAGLDPDFLLKQRTRERTQGIDAPEWGIAGLSVAAIGDEVIDEDESVER